MKQIDSFRLLYAYGGCSPRKYREYVESRGARAQQQSQKYNQLLMEGFVRNGVEVHAVSSRPINRSLTRQFFFPGERDAENGVEYTYLPFFNFPVLRHLSLFLCGFFHMVKSCREGSCRILCDALNISVSAAAWLAGKLCGVPVFAIITDVPCHRPAGVKAGLAEHIDLWLMGRFDGYLLLTEDMNDLVNPGGRPYVVLEGHADLSMKNRENRPENKAEGPVVLYAGTLRKIYGIEMLVRGFLQADIPGAELHIYGDGDFAGELRELAREDARIHYMGIAPNAEIVEAELRASLLVNPRPTHEEYTRYSFPSKNMEYMASGTPVLTTRLPGMPEEYLPYVHLIEEETVEGVAKALTDALGTGAEELHRRGMEAREFILREKNNAVQAAKVMELLR